MVLTKMEIGLSPKEIEQIKAAQKKHSVIDPGCEKLTPEEIINWHPAGGISWEERARRMAAAGFKESEEAGNMETNRSQLIPASK